MARHNMFYVYAGPGTAVIKAVDALEEYLKKKRITVEGAKLTEDRRTIHKYLLDHERILFILVRMKYPENSKCVCKGHHFEAYLTTGIATEGGYEGQRVPQLCLVPAKPEEGC